MAENEFDGKCWYVVKTHPKQEDRAEKNLRVYGVETLCPKIKRARYNEFTGKPTYLTSPLFPNYLFAKFEINSVYHKVKFTRGVHGLVGFNNSPAVVEEKVIAIINSRRGSDGYVAIGASRSAERFQPGDNVIVNSGPLRNFTGIFEREMPDSDRVRVLLQTVNYQAHAELDANALTRVSAAGGGVQ